MKVEKNILIAFLLNISFSIFELIGGLFTNSVAIISDAIHDFGDATSIGISYFLEKKSNRKPDNKYTYGYIRYSILGAIITNTVLVTGSVFVIVSAIKRIIDPIAVNYNGMIIFAIFGVAVNFLAAYFTREGSSLNQKAVNLHMLEDVLGWIVVLIGSILIRYTKIDMIDSIMSIGVAVFILFSAFKSFKLILDLFLEKVPEEISIDELKKHILKVSKVKDVHHIHVWSMDGTNNFATVHVVTDTKDEKKLKEKLREELKEHGISHVTIEIEKKSEECTEENCVIDNVSEGHLHHHHH